MDVYIFSFGVLTIANCLLGYLSTRPAQTSEDEASEESFLEKQIQCSADAKEFQRSFLLVYTFVVAADWLQAPYMYTLYRDEKGLTESVVAMLFATGFVSAAVSSSFVGDFANRNGRKYACLCSCGIYAASCLTTLSNYTFVLSVGRILSGMSIAIMSTVPETWMVAEFHTRVMREKGLNIDLVYCRMGTVSGVIAIVAGVLGQILVDLSGWKAAPFLAAVGCLGIAAVLISSLWPENYGSKVKSKEDSVEADVDIKAILKDKELLSLSLTHTIFESTICLFVFFWSPALISSSIITTTNTLAIQELSLSSPQPPPFGLAFATVMSAKLLISLTYNPNSKPNSHSNTQISTSSSTGITTNGFQSTVESLTITIMLTAASLLTIVQVTSKTLTLWAFCVFQAAAGMYSPSMSSLKRQIIRDEGVRAEVNELLKVPVNLLVLVVLVLVKDGDGYRDNVFLTCSGLLIVAYVVCHRYLSQA